VVAPIEQRVTVDALYRLAATLESLDIGPDASAISDDRDRLAGTIRSYLIPRALDPELPMTVVVAGPTGSGKSTVINSLSGADASRTGALRPTTKKPVVVASPGRTGEFEFIGGVRCDIFAHAAPILETMILVDAPDIDSTSTRHRAMAEALIDSADVVVFVTSALRYADDVPWQILRRARSRGAPVIHVLNRVTSSSAGSAIDFRSRLSTAGMDDDLISVSEHRLPDGAHRVPPVAVQALGERLGEVASSREVRSGEIFRGVLSATLGQVIELMETVVGTRDEIDVFESEMARRLLARVPEFDFAGVVLDLFPTVPMKLSRRATRRWKRAASLPTPDVETVESKLVDRMVTAVAADVRGWLTEERPTLREWGIDAKPVIDAVVVAARAAAEGWVDYVGRIAVDFEESEAWLGEAVLIDAVISGETGLAVEATFGDGGPVLVDRARRELVGRLEVVYQQVARFLADTLRDRYGEPHELELRASVGAVTATLAPINA
jgi:energy-coupling factor transporter ATP-binding protein EcfA2